MKHVFDVLAAIRLQPHKFVGGDGTTDRVELLRNIEVFIDGFSMGAGVHNSPEPVQDFHKGFSAWLRKTHKGDPSCGFAAAMKGRTKSPEEAWERFWVLVDEYYQDVCSVHGVSMSPIEDEEEVKERNIFDMLATIHARPSMYVGSYFDHRRNELELLRRLELMLNGYALAVGIHSSPEPVPDFVKGFSVWLETKCKWDLTRGLTAALAKHTRSAKAAWERFWALVEEYRKDLGVELTRPEPRTR